MLPTRNNSLTSRIQSSKAYRKEKEVSTSCYSMKHWLLNFKTAKNLPQKSTKESKTLKLQRNKSTKLDKVIAVLPIAQVFCSSALSIWPELIQCISILCNGLSTCSKCQSRMHYLLRNSKQGSLIWLITLHTLSTKMSVDRYLKNINCFSHFYLPRR